jgi:hypothetical protein
MIQFTVNIPAGPLARLTAAMQPDELDKVVDRVGLQTFASVVQATPQKWFGQVRKSWQLSTPGQGSRLVKNDNKIMLFLEEGTQAHGPVTAKALYIPLTRKAAFGYQPGFVWGTDFILTPWVKGITARHIAKAEAEKAQKLLTDSMQQHIRDAIK